MSKLLILKEEGGNVGSSSTTSNSNVSSSDDERIPVVYIPSGGEAAAEPTSTSTTTFQQPLNYSKDEFQKSYQLPPRYVSRAPGRVNIIGEHIDYNGFGVLPMALQQSIFVACSSSSTKTTTTDNDNDHSSSVLTLNIQSTSPQAQPRRYVYQWDQLLSFFSSDSSNSEEEKNQTQQTALFPPFDSSTCSNRDWSHYVLCAFFGVLEHLLSTTTTSFQQQSTNTSSTELYLLIHGTVPQGAGVSSSSALVVSSALAFLALLLEPERQPQQQQSMGIISTPPQIIAKLCAKCERWVGTEGGGMDQAISIFATPNCGRYIQFRPTFQHRPIPFSLPSSTNVVADATFMSWVVCHSLEESHKRQDAATLFNKRVVECRIGCYYLLLALQQQASSSSSSPHPSSLSTLQLWDIVHQSNLTLEELETIVKERIPKTCTKQELLDQIIDPQQQQQQQLQQIAKELGITRPAGLEVLKVAESFCIRDRLLHVLSETRRVQEFVSICCGSSDNDDYKTTETAAGSKSRTLGNLMKESHYSCSKIYDCSSSQVDQLQQVCIEAPGTLGSRMTGAGWGGCVISLVLTDKVDEFCQHVREKYYVGVLQLLATAESANENNKRREEDYMFVTTPSQGCNLFCIQ